MEVISVWLIHHKAAMELYSPMNLDGSEYMIGVAVVPATDMKTAIDKFEDYLANKKMSTIEITKCEQWDSKNFPDHSFEHEEINTASGASLESNTIYYILGASSEAIEFNPSKTK